MKSYVFPPARLSKVAISTITIFQALALVSIAQAQTALVTVADSNAVVLTTNIPVPASGGTTYVLEKYAPGPLTIGGQLTGGSGSILRTTTDTAGDTSTVLEFAATNSGYAGSIQLYQGSVQVDNPLSLGTGTIYADGAGGLPGDLVFKGGMIFTNPIVLQSSTASISAGSNYVILSGNISGVGSLTEYGSGTLNLGASNGYTGGTIISAGTLVLGTSNAIPSGPGVGNVTMNGTLDVNGFSPLINNLSGSGIVDDVNAGGTPVLTVSNSTTSTFAGSIQNSSGALELNLIGSGILTLTGTNTYTGITTVNSAATLQLGPGGVLGGSAVLDLGTLALNRPDVFTVPNDIAGSGNLQQNGSGMAMLTGNLTYTGPTTVNAGTLAFPGNITFDASSGTILNIAAGATASISSSVFNLNVNPTSVAVDVAGGGTLQLASTLNSLETFSDINFGPNQSGTADFGCRLSANLDLGAIHRTIYGWTGGNDVARNGLLGADCQFGGSISGTAELTLQGQNTLQGVNALEVPFVLLASNSFTGPLEIQRGSVYLGNANALTTSNVLIMDAPANQNARFFLYGFNAAISDLQTSGFGDAVIADGNNITTKNVGPATLSITQNNPFTFAGEICDWFTEYTSPLMGPLTPVLNLVKNGPAALTLTGSNTYSGTTTINAGKLYINGAVTGSGMIVVNNGGTLGGSGSIGSTNIIVQNKGSIETGSGSGLGNLQLNSVTFGSTTTDTSTLNVSTAAMLNVVQTNGLIINSGTHSVVVHVAGPILFPGTFPLISYQGAIGGNGFGSFSLGSLPPGVAGLLSNDTTHHVVNLIVVQVGALRWTGKASSEWSTNIIATPKNWLLANGVTAADYADGEQARFDDSSTNPLVNLNAANVSPWSVTVSNAAENYVFNGNFGITGVASLTKQGIGQLLLNTTNSYTGSTTIAAGTLVLGNASAIPGGIAASNVAINGTLDLARFSPTLNNLSGSGIVDDVSAGGFPILTVFESTNTAFNGAVQNSSGTLGLTLTGGGVLSLNGNNNTYTGPTLIANGTLLVNGALTGSTVVVPAGSTLGGTGIIQGNGSLSNNAVLSLIANQPLTMGALSLNGQVTVAVSGNFSVTNAGTYTLLNHGTESGGGTFALSAVTGILDSGFTASLNDTNNQLQLVIAPAGPSGTIRDVKHVVIFMQENRSFDHYFGSLHGVHGFSDRNALRFQNGNTVFYQPSGTSYELPFHTTISCLTDTPHDWNSTHQAFNSGNNNQWVAAKGKETMNYVTRSDLPYYYALADAYTICDEYHCSALTSTDPNRLYLWTGMIDPSDTGGGPVINNNQPAAGWGTAWVTYPEFLQQAGVTWKVYQQSDNANDNALAWFASYKQATAGEPLYDNGEKTVSNLAVALKADVTNNTLPSVSWIVAPSASDEHPPHSPQSGEVLTKTLLDAIASNPTVYNSTVFILLYDENDGFFDHEIPILPAAGTTNEFVGGLPIGLGVRLPFIIVSPWTRGGRVCSQVFDATSVIQFLEKWTGVKDPNITAWRRQVCGDLTSAFDFAHPNTNYPTLPTVTAVTCSSGTTPDVPATQSMPTQESGTLIACPLPYQPNTVSFSDPVNRNFDITLTNSGTVSVHFTIYPNAYRSDGPWPYDIAASNSITVPFNVLATGGSYDFSCYGPNDFLRRYSGNFNAQGNQIEVTALLNPSSDNVELVMTNGTASAITFTVADNYATNSHVFSVSPASMRAVEFLSSTNNGWYDLTATLNGSTNFLRRFAGHIETNSSPSALVSSKNASGYKDNVTFTTAVTGYTMPSGTVQFKTNGVAYSSPVTLNNGSASFSTAALARGSNLITAEYSGDTLNPPLTNSLAQIVTNHPPVAGTAIYARGNNLSLQIPINNLLAHVSDIDGDSIALIGVGNNGFNQTTTNGATLTTNTVSIIYTNSVTPNVNDAFNYAVSDGQGGTNIGTVLVKLSSTIFDQTNVVTMSFAATQVTVNFYGIPGTPYIVERSTNLISGSGWVPISTNTAPANGLFQIQDNFHDLGIPIPPVPTSVFYNLRYNQ